MKKFLFTIILLILSSNIFALDDITKKDVIFFVNGGAGFAFGDNIKWEKDNFTLTETFYANGKTVTKTAHPTHMNLFFGANLEVLLLKNDFLAFGPRVSYQYLVTRQSTSNNGEENGVKYEGGTDYSDTYLSVTPILAGGVLYTNIGLYLVGQIGFISGDIYPLANKTSQLIKDSVSGWCYNVGLGYAGVIGVFYFGVEATYEPLFIKMDKLSYPFGKDFTQHNVNFALSLGLAF